MESSNNVVTNVEDDDGVIIIRITDPQFINFQLTKNTTAFLLKYMIAN